MQTMEISNKTSRNELMASTGKGNPLSMTPSDTLSVEKLEKWLDELRNQPRWRLVADKECDYYDGNQLDADTLELMESRGQAPIIDNLIQPTINAVLGMQAKSRVDTRVAPEAGETNTDVAEALSLKMKQSGESARSDRAKSDAYAEQIKVGIGWVEVARNSDPFKPTVRYQHVHRREIFWDWRAKQPDLSDARYLVRRKWMDEDVLLTAFPGSADFIRAALSGRSNWDIELTGANLMTRGMDSDVTTGFSVSTEQYEWMNVTRKRLCVYEVWYRVHVQGQVVKLPNGRTIEFNEDDPQHQQAFYAGMIQPMPAAFDRVRVAFYIGPHLVDDRASPYRHRHFPYVPFFGFREDRTGIPYGLIRSMMSPQDEINARKAKMYWLINAKRVMATEGAVADHNVAAEEVARPDAYVIVSNKPNEKFEVEENQQLAAEQFKVMQEAKESIQANVGVHNATLGRDSGATSGLAINSLVEQDSITLAELNDNFNMAARQADELLLSLIIEDLSDAENESVIVEDDGGKKREIILNQKTIDPETQMPVIINDVTKINVAVVLADTPTTPTFRNQQLNQMSDVMKALPPNVQGMLLPLYLEATDLPQRKKMAEIISKGLGLSEDDGDDPEKQQMKQTIEQGMKMIQDLQAQLKAKNPPEVVAAQVAKLNAETDNLGSRTVETYAKGLYEMIQTAMAAASNPALMPIADSIGKSIGFKDQDGSDIADTQQIPQSAVGAPMGNATQTEPMTPSQPIAPEMQQSDIPQDPQMQSPAQGVAGGIEQQGNQI
ncbi:MAG: portal protein [Methylobacter sp.]